MSKANDRQPGGDHYQKRKIQPWDYIAANELGFFEGNIVKYVTRWRDKDGGIDLLKAQHYLEKLIEVEAIEQPAPEVPAGTDSAPGRTHQAPAQTETPETDTLAYHLLRAAMEENAALRHDIERAVATNSELATELTRARNDALDEAANTCIRIDTKPDWTERQAACSACAAAIRALKEPK